MDSDKSAIEQPAPQATSRATPALILVTGVTGFLGKVVLEELVRRRNNGTVQFEKLVVLIRQAGGKPPTQRFYDKVVQSPCFKELPPEWHQDIVVVSGDLMEADCGVSPDTLAMLSQQTTHIIHCAGCVGFESSLNVLLAENVTTSANMLGLAQRCAHLQRLVMTSTAYVTPHTNEPIWERLVALPRPADVLLDDLHQGRRDAAEMLAETGHPNKYTLAKCLAEHVVAQKMGRTPVTIVRPSIISASLQHPFPGWIDSFAALAAPISAFALGGLKVLHGDPDAVLDVVPVDAVATCLIDEALGLAKYGSCDLNNMNAQARIAHCVSTTARGPRTRDLVFGTVDYFAQPDNVVLHKPKGCYVGQDDRLFCFYDFFFQYLPVKVAELAALMRLDWTGAARARKTMVRLQQVDTHFRFFVEHTYDYRCEASVLDPDFDKDRYFSVVLMGLRQNMLVPLVAKMQQQHANAADQAEARKDGSAQRGSG
ncbi:male sterility protein-domain-containing protein [Coniella lustricola]|uniref:Fatty acyl-CoA reductase n=1 Tax=Coniella lustricola TaxID=2025994 RepID=A0A2T2ZU85_9PEZI|nr:male sterility protein-domain-containing protein [Coniella lustricola]